MKRYRVTRRYISEEVIEVDAANKEEADQRAEDAIGAPASEGNPNIIDPGSTVRFFRTRIEIVR